MWGGATLRGILSEYNNRGIRQGEKMRLRFKGWQRIGIVASVLWFFGGGLWGNKIGLHEGDYVTRAYTLCIDEASGEQWKSCESTFRHDWPLAIQYHWWYAAIIGIVPIPIAWLVTYGLIGLFHWIRRGFRPTAT
jgi:hypothetical protein